MNVVEKGKKAQKVKEKEKSNVLAPEKLNRMRSLHLQLNNIKIGIADLRMREVAMLQECDRIKLLLAEEEKDIIAQHGMGAKINLDTGVVTNQ